MKTEKIFKIEYIKKTPTGYEWLVLSPKGDKDIKGFTSRSLDEITKFLNDFIRRQNMHEVAKRIINFSRKY